MRTDASFLMAILRFLRPCARAAWLLAACSACAWAQQDTADRLWQGTEQQLQQSRQQSRPAPPEQGPRGRAFDSALQALAQSPYERVQQLTFAILNAVNQHHWFAADRLLRDYAEVPQHDPALQVFVTASRAAAEGDFDAAIEGYREVLRANPRFTRGELDLARVLYADNQLRDAQRIFERLRTQQLPPEISRHIDAYLQAVDQRGRLRVSLSVSAVREDNLNSASTLVDPCAVVFFGLCLPNEPGEKAADNGVYVEAALHKLWSLSGGHGLLLRSINYGNRYRHEQRYDNLASTTYLGYQYTSARSQFQLLPLFEYAEEGGRRIYHASGVRTSLGRQLGERAQLEASYEYKARHFSSGLQHLQGDFQSLGLFGSYALRADLALYGNLVWRRSDAQLDMFAYRERIVRLGFHKSFAGQLVLNAAYGHRQKQADGIHPVFGRRQRDHENSLYLSASLPGHSWQGLTPTVSYEVRDNRSNIAHAYSYEKSRIALGFNKVF